MLRCVEKRKARESERERERERERFVMKAGGDVVAVHTGLCTPSVFAAASEQQNATAATPLQAQNQSITAPTTMGENVGGTGSMLCHAWNGDRTIVAISPNSREVRK